MESIDGKKKVSIILATYNGAETIKETISSLLGQNYENLEVIVVDDGSTDKTASIVKEFKDFRVKYFYQKNSGSPSAPRNKGIKEATGEFVGFCDQEDIWYREKLEKQLKAYESATNKDNIGIVFSSADIIDKSGKKINSNITPIEGFLEDEEAYGRLLNYNFITACSALVPKKVIEEIGFLDESLIGVDDYDLWLRISQKYGVLGITEALCAWRTASGSLSADKTKLYKENEKIFDKLENKEQSVTVRIGHGKNLMKIFVSAVLSKRYAEASEYKNKATKYPLSRKAKFMIFIFDTNHVLSFYVMRFLQKIGKISL